MVVDREKYLASRLRLETERLVEAVQSLNPTTKKAREAKDEWVSALKEANRRLETLHRHYCTRRHRKPPP